MFSYGLIHITPRVHHRRRFHGHRPGYITAAASMTIAPVSIAATVTGKYPRGQEHVVNLVWSANSGSAAATIRVPTTSKLTNTVNSTLRARMMLRSADPDGRRRRDRRRLDDG